MTQKILSKYKCIVKMVKLFPLKDEAESNAFASFLVLLKYICSKCDLQNNPQYYLVLCTVTRVYIAL